MFSLEHLHRLRAAELAAVVPLFPTGAHVLELGAGTGYQARELAARGFRVTAVDLAGSTYAADRVFPVHDYDGRHLPLPGAAVDVVFSSNVLEHVHDIDGLMAEMARVLAPGGRGVHILPSPAWRFWTLVAGWLDLGPLLWEQCRQLGGRRQSLPGWLMSTLRGIAGRTLPVRHGERGTALSELWTFGSGHWRRQFERGGFEVSNITPMGLFYTGFMVLGPHLSLTARARLARVAGSACTLYCVRRRSRS